MAHGGGAVPRPENGVRVGYITGVVLGLSSLYAVFVFPWRHPRAFFTMAAASACWGAVWLGFGGSMAALDDLSLAVWVPMLAMGCWIWTLYGQGTHKHAPTVVPRHYTPDEIREHSRAVWDGVYGPGSFDDTHHWSHDLVFHMGKPPTLPVPDDDEEDFGTFGTFFR